MTRRCSHCSNNGHNSRTCPTRTTPGIKLFGVRLTDGSIMKKSASMGNLSALYHPSSPAAALSPNPTSPDPIDGYLSDDPAHAKRRQDRKKGTPWTEEEHRLFLLGLQKLGKGDWRGIARNYVLSRTPTQVASHAQKYFIRQCNASRRKRRSSLFDMAPDMAAETPEDQFMLPPAAGMGGEKLKENVKEESSKQPVNELPPVIPAFYPAYIPVPFPVWPSTMAQFESPTNYNSTEPDASHHRVVKPIPVLSKEPMNLDELVGMSKQLSLKDPEQQHNIEPSPLSLKLLAEPSRQSAFHASTPVMGGGSCGVNKGGDGGPV
ncbi:transcription factor MYBS3 isoform X2 [Helianthus annuus]|uniref:transcription factor MYBS3 isoform X2 n=1 Tax=Helianthus annuus TaxID=4232 RepID=UPI001652CA3C|nr:transcription factor MYBS3 isoform X2 [Helianthus annuus]